MLIRKKIFYMKLSFECWLDLLIHLFETLKFNTIVIEYILSIFKFDSILVLDFNKIERRRQRTITLAIYTHTHLLFSLGFKRIWLFNVLATKLGWNNWLKTWILNSLPSKSSAMYWKFLISITLITLM